MCPDRGNTERESTRRNAWMIIRFFFIVPLLSFLNFMSYINPFLFSSHGSGRETGCSRVYQLLLGGEIVRTEIVLIFRYLASS